MPPSQASQIADMQAHLAALEQRIAAQEIAARQTHDMVEQMHDALMKPTPGQTKGLLDRIATVAISIESGERVAGWAVKIAGLLAAVGAIYAALRWGTSQ